MTMRKVLAIVVLGIPIVAWGWIFATFQSADAALAVQSPRYPDVSATALANLTKEQLATATASTIAEYKRMDELWRSIRASEERLLHALLIATVFLALGCAILLWRSSPNSTVEGDARNGGARPSP